MDNLTRDEIGTICRELIFAINPNRAGREGVLQGTSRDANKLLSPVESCNINFHWWEERFDVLNHYRHKFPPTNSVGEFLASPRQGRRYASLTPVTPLKTIERKEANPDTVSTEHVASVQRIGSAPATSTRDEPSSEQTQRQTKKRKLQVKCAAAYSIVPRFYYKPWPNLTHKLTFTEDEFRKYPELAAATLSNYKAREQSEDSIDLGLRIVAHLIDENTPITIIPNMAIWRILEKPEIADITLESVSSQLNVNDLRRAACPYISVGPGLSKGFATMMLWDHHWYVVLLTEADQLVDCMVKTIVSTSLESETDPNDVSSTMDAYRIAVDEMSIPGVKLAVMDSIGLDLEERGWESVKKFMFISLVQAIASVICAAPIQERFGGFSEKSACDQQVHFSCISYHVLMKILWPSSYFVSGPEQFNGRTCGAFGLASIWKLSTTEGYDEMHHFLCSQNENNSPDGTRTSLPSSRKGPRKAKHTQYGAKKVPFLRFQTFYDVGLVHHVLSQLDMHIRKKISNREANNQTVVID